MGQLPDPLLFSYPSPQQMNRKQYKNARHYLRWLARYINGKINWEAVDTAYIDMITNGRNEISFEDLLL